MQYLQKMFFIEWNQKFLIKILRTTEKSLDSRIKEPLENMINWEGKDSKNDRQGILRGCRGKYSN